VIGKVAASLAHILMVCDCLRVLDWTDGIQLFSAR